MLDWSAEIHVTNSTAAQRINYLPIS
jgi:hypothetical protein